MIDDCLVAEPAANRDVDATIGWHEGEQSDLGIRSSRELAEA